MDNRPLKSTAFEVSDSGFVYFATAWAKGIEVSAEERELYLSGAHADWLRVILGREQTAPRRPWLKAVRRISSAALFGFDPNDPDHVR